MDRSEFGRYLTQQRELRGLSRDEIAEATKIPPHLLEALERGETTRLPSRAFVLHYVRAYASTIGMAPEDAVLRYEEVDAAELPVPAAEISAPPRIAKRVPKHTPKHTQVGWRLVVGGVLLAMLAAAVVWMRGH
ncbi:MAG: helix-turn-helix domain-containing protein [Myxococcaceae bacterium]